MVLMGYDSSRFLLCLLSATDALNCSQLQHFKLTFQLLPHFFLNWQINCFQCLDINWLFNCFHLFHHNWDFKSFQFLHFNWYSNSLYYLAWTMTDKSPALKQHKELHWRVGGMLLRYQWDNEIRSRMSSLSNRLTYLKFLIKCTWFVIAYSYFTTLDCYHDGNYFSCRHDNLEVNSINTAFTLHLIALSRWRHVAAKVARALFGTPTGSTDRLHLNEWACCIISRRVQFGLNAT